MKFQDDENETPERRGFLALVSTRSLMKAFFLLLVLGAVIFLRGRAGSIAKVFDETLVPPVQRISAPPVPAPSPGGTP